MPDYLTEHHGGGLKYQLHIPAKLRPLLGNKSAIVRYIPRMKWRDAQDIARKWAVEDKALFAVLRELPKNHLKTLFEAAPFDIRDKASPRPWRAYSGPEAASLPREVRDKLLKQALIADAIQSMVETKVEERDLLLLSWDRLFSEWKRVRTPRQTRDQEVTIHLLKGYFGERDCRSITPQDIAKFRDHLLTTDTTRGMVHTRLKQIKAMFSGASQEPDSPFHGMPNPATGIKLLGEKPPVKEVIPFSPRQVRTIFDTVQTTGFGQDRNAEVLLLLRVIAFTGARPNEIAQLQGGDVLEENGVKLIRIRQTDAVSGALHPQKSVKKGDGRDVPLHDAILGFFNHAGKFEPGAFIFGCFRWNRKFGRINYIGTRFSDFLKLKCKIVSSDPNKKYVLYSLRHSFHAAMDKAEVPDKQQQRLVGHSKSVHERYGGADLPLLRDYVNKLKIVE